MIAASVAFGMNLKYGEKKAKALNTIKPVKRPPIGVRTPELLLIALREKLPVAGKADTNDPAMLQHPRATISCVAFNRFP